MSAHEEQRDAIMPDDELLGAALRDAYPTASPTDRVRQRGFDAVARFESAPPGRRVRGPLRRWGWRGGLGLVFAATSALAVHLILNRSGEAAVRLIPADALVVATLDTKPSPAQVPLFKRMDDAMKREGLDGKLDDGLRTLASDSPVASLIRPHLTNDLALAVLDHEGRTFDQDDANPTFIMALKDPRAVSGILESHTHKVQADGLTCYQMQGREMYGMLIESYLVLAPSTADLARIVRVHAGADPSVADLAEYRDARAALPGDATVMCFISPTAIERAGKATGRRLQPSGGPLWVAWSATLQDAGIRIDYRCPTQTGDAMRWAQRIAQIAPISEHAYHEMPAGAHGVVALSQPGRYWDAVNAAAASDADMHEAVQADMRDLEDLAGLSLERDVLPAYEGQCWFGVYPDDSWNGKVGLVAVMDDANGADPAALFTKAAAAMDRALAPENRDRLRNWMPLRHIIGALPFGGLANIGRTSVDYDGPTPHLVPFERDGVHMWRLDPHSQAELQRGARSFRGSSSSGGTPEPAFAQVGHSMVFATSQPLLDRAVASLQGHASSLADDPAYSAMRRSATAGAQSVCMVDVHRILEAFRPQIVDLLRDSGGGIAPDDVIGLMGDGNSGLVVSSQYDGRVATGTVAIPLDYDRLIHLVGCLTRDTGATRERWHEGARSETNDASPHQAPSPPDATLAPEPADPDASPEDSPKAPEPSTPDVTVQPSGGRPGGWRVRVGTTGPRGPENVLDIGLPASASTTLRPGGAPVTIELRSVKGTTGGDALWYQYKGSHGAPSTGLFPQDLMGQVDLKSGSRGTVVEMLQTRVGGTIPALRQETLTPGQPLSREPGVYIEITPGAR